MKPTIPILTLILGLVICYLIFNKAPEVVTNTVTITTIETDSTEETSDKLPEIIPGTPVVEYRWKTREVDSNNIMGMAKLDSAGIIKRAKQDTIEALKDYFTRKPFNYIDTINQVAIHIESELFMNAYSCFLVGVVNLKATTINNTDETTVVYPLKWFAGAKIQGNSGSLDVYGMIGYKPKKTLFMAGYSPLTKTAEIGVMKGFNF